MLRNNWNAHTDKQTDRRRRDINSLNYRQTVSIISCQPASQPASQPGRDPFGWLLPATASVAGEAGWLQEESKRQQTAQKMSEFMADKKREKF